MESKKDFLNLAEFLPSEIVVNTKNKVKCSHKIERDGIFVYYNTIEGNNSKKEYSTRIPNFISKTKETFEVLGLLQAEMGKTQNGNLSFSNHEYQIINRVINWFDREFEFNDWRWSIKLNIQEPKDLDYKKEIEDKVVNYWLNKVKIKQEKAYPKKVTYIKNTKNTELIFYDEGTLVLEYKNNLFSQIIKSFVKKITYTNILNEDLDLIRGFMKGIIAGEGCVQNDPKTWHYTVHVSASNKEEREIYKILLNKLNINIKLYTDYKEMLISKRENLIQLLNQRLMTLSKEKYSKFLVMMQQYPNIKEETGLFKPKGENVWNKIPQDKIEKVTELYKKEIKPKEIASRLEISLIKVYRVLKENNLGRRLHKTPEEKRKQIAEFLKRNPKMKKYEVADYFKVHPKVISRVIRKYLRTNS